MSKRNEGVEYTLWRLTNDALSDEVVASVIRAGEACRLAIVSGVEGAIFEESYPDIETLMLDATDQRIELERQGWTEDEEK